ncbi:uncharacterized protein LOC120321218 [Drosophila yakuba]|uniref:uncharacterized protein LOC120321218 n=1 Tax=Drosophila yakuba TaxID=7245 RepID=UPI0019307996|nr:uncharacterized protein LOC120321218 [Drosophila yakuba]
MRHSLVLLIFGLVWQNIHAMNIHPESSYYDAADTDGTDMSMISVRLKNVENKLSDLYEMMDKKNLVEEPKITLSGDTASPFTDIENIFTPETESLGEETSLGTAFIPIGTKNYYIENFKKQTWPVAQYKCKLMGGVLFSPRTQAVWEAVRSNLDQNKDYWTNIREHASYVFGSSYEKAEFVEFDENFQNMCIQLDSQSNHLMNEVDCDIKNYFICELGL